MQVSRRSLLTGTAAAVTIGTAGCSETTDQEGQSEDYRTLTPAEVPGESLDTIARIETLNVPKVPLFDPVNETHIEAAIQHLDVVLQEVETAIKTGETATRPDSTDENGSMKTSTDPANVLAELRTTRDQLRTRSPSLDVLFRCRRAIRSAASLSGSLQALTETIDEDALLEELHAIVRDIGTFPAKTDYRLIEPYNRSLAALDLAERTIPTVNDSVEAALDADAESLSEISTFFARAPGRIETSAYLREHLAELRRALDDSRRFRAIGTDPEADARKAVLQNLLDQFLAEAKAFDADEPASALSDLSVPHAVRPSRRMVVTDLRLGDLTIDRVRRRRTADETARALMILARWLVRATGIRDAAETLYYLDDVEFETVLAAKRGTVGMIERLAAADPLSRSLGRMASTLVSDGDLSFKESDDARLFSYIAYIAAERISMRAIHRSLRITAAI